MSNVVIFSWGYYPAKTYGGPAISIENLVKVIVEEFKSVTVVCNAHELNSKKLIKGINANTINEGVYGENILYLDEEHKNFDFIKQQLKPLGKIDLIYVNSFFAWKQLALASKLRKANSSNILIAPRGELEKNALAIKAPKNKLYISILRQILKKENTFFHATNEIEKENIKKQLKAKDEKILILDNIPSLPDETFYKVGDKKKLDNHLDLVFVSRIQSKKNLKYALECLEKIPADITINYDIYGPVENREYFEECQAVVKRLPKQVKVEYKGLVDHDLIFDVFRKYDLFFFPTLSENFGHVIAEALAAKVLILISDQTPWTDINKTKAGKAIPLELKAEFSKYIIDLAKVSNEEFVLFRDQGLEYLEGKLNINETKEDYRQKFRKISTK